MVATLLIAGSRTFKGSYWHVYSNASYVFDRPFDLVISGGAKGIDRDAERWAEFRGYPFQEYPADWSRYGKSAGYIRNRQMVEACDAAICVWDGSSFGTSHTIDLLEKNHKSFVMVRLNETHTFVTV